MTRREYNKQYYLNNKDKLKEDCRNYRNLHREKSIEIAKKWRIDNKDRFLKLQKKYKYKQMEILRNLSNSLKIKCKYCECNNPECIDWHHIIKNNKKLVTRIITDALSEKRLLEEIYKCESVCANCHRKLHKTTGLGTQAKKGKYIYNLKLNSKCKHCNISEPVCLVFHHKNPKEKIDTISEIVRNKKYSIEDLKNEINKCDIVCFNCHRLIHSNYNNFKLN